MCAWFYKKGGYLRLEVNGAASLVLDIGPGEVRRQWLVGGPRVLDRPRVELGWS